nr:hypothetical protein B0A51_15974 [Rachicladosporium sp. CCFEE 5018]
MPPRRPPPRPPVVPSPPWTSAPTTAASPPTQVDLTSQPSTSHPSTPASPSASLPTVTPTSTRGRGRAPVAKPKFTGRRSNKSRAELEKEEADRKREESDRKAKEARVKFGGARGRGDGRGRGRLRGGYMGEGERRKGEGAAVMSGPFSLGEAVTEVKGGGRGWTSGGRSGGGGGGGGGTSSGVGGGGGGGGSGGGGGGGSSSGASGSRSSVKQEPGANGSSHRDVQMMDSRTMIKSEDGGYISSGDDEDDKAAGGRRNIDDLALIDLTADDDASGAAPGGFAPVRIQRVEHRDRALGLKEDAAKVADTSALIVEANDIPSSPTLRRRGKGKQRAKEVEIVSEQHAYQGVYSDSSSEGERRPRIKPEPIDDDDDRLATPPGQAPTASMLPPQSPPSSPEARKKAKDRVKQPSFSTQNRPEFETNEDALEWELKEKDLRILRDELGTSAPSTATQQNGEDAEMPDISATDPRQDKVYLFQFPPILPDLKPITVKPDPDSPSATSTSFAPPPTKPAGFVGKLNIHASGRATLDWGGVPMEMGMGIEASFLQDVIIAELEKKRQDAVEGEESGETKEKVVGGRAMGMGQVKGKFVVVPSWEGI